MAAAVFAAPANAAEVRGQFFVCPLPHGYHAARSNDAIPPAIRTSLPDAAPMGAPWNGSDMADDKPMSGIEFAVWRGRHWILGIGHGGGATSLEFHAYRLKRDGTIATSETVEPYSSSCGGLAKAAAG